MLAICATQRAHSTENQTRTKAIFIYLSRGRQNDDDATHMRQLKEHIYRVGIMRPEHRIRHVNTVNLNVHHPICDLGVT